MADLPDEPSAPPSAGRWGRDPWGADDPPAVESLPGPTGLTGLPDVRRLVDQGWFLLDDAPALWALPAAWPPHLRCWVPARRPRVPRASTAGPGPASVARLATDPERNDPDGDRDAYVESLGLAAPPTDRRWLVRSPWPTVLPPAALLRVVQSLASGRDGVVPPTVGHDPCAEVARVLLRDPSPDGLTGVRDLCAQTAVGAACLAWADAGADVRDHLALALAGATPGELERVQAVVATHGLLPSVAAPLRAVLVPETVAGWAAHLADGCVTLTEIQACAEQWALDPDHLRPLLHAGWPLADAIRLPHGHDVAGFDAAGWRATGLPGAAVTALVLARWSLQPEELGPWAAIGVEPGTLASLLRADPELTPVEWQGFRATGLPDDVARDWVAHGFAADAAAAWEAVGDVPAEARVWRSRGLGPADVPPHGPGELVLPEGGWGFVGGEDRRDRTWSCMDPPGTRGRVAREDGAD